MTNAEKIRAMTDEELAKWFAGRITDCIDCPAYETCDDVKVGWTSCIDLLLRWLEQEADDDES